MTVVRGVASLFRVDCRNSLVDPEHRNPCPYSATSCQPNCITVLSKRQTSYRHRSTFQNHLRPFQSQSVWSTLVSEDLMTSSLAAPFPRFGSRPLAAPWPFFIFCFILLLRIRSHREWFLLRARYTRYAYLNTPQN